MAFTDLAEHLGEVFGDARLEHPQEGFQRGSISDRATRTTEGYFRKVKAKRKREKAAEKVKRRVNMLSAFASGERPRRCQRSGCCNLLVPKPGSIVRTCSDVCRTTLWRQNRG